MAKSGRGGVGPPWRPSGLDAAPNVDGGVDLGQMAGGDHEPARAASPRMQQHGQLSRLRHVGVCLAGGLAGRRRRIGILLFAGRCGLGTFIPRLSPAAPISPMAGFQARDRSPNGAEDGNDTATEIGPVYANRVVQQLIVSVDDIGTAEYLPSP